MKKLLAMLLTAVMLITCTAVPAFAEDVVMWGDANFDGKINLLDCTYILQHIAGWDMTDKGFNPDLADGNQDGKINLHDVKFILNMFFYWEPKA